MPDRLAVAKIADRLAVLDHVGDDVEFRMRLVERLAVGVRPRRIELSEVPAEGNQLWIRQTLPMEDDDKPLAPRGFDRVDIGLRQRLRDVDTVDFRAQRGVQISDRHSHRLSLDASRVRGSIILTQLRPEKKACSGAVVEVMPRLVRRGSRAEILGVFGLDLFGRLVLFDRIGGQHLDPRQRDAVCGLDDIRVEGAEMALVDE